MALWEAVILGNWSEEKGFWGLYFGIEWHNLLTYPLFPPKGLYDSKLGKGVGGLSSKKTHYNFKPSCPCVCRVDVESGQSSVGVEVVSGGITGWQHVYLWLQVRLDPRGAHSPYRFVYWIPNLAFCVVSILVSHCPRWSFAQAHSVLVVHRPGPSQLALCGLPSQHCTALSPHQPQQCRILSYLAFHVCGHALLSTLHLPSL